MGLNVKIVRSIAGDYYYWESGPCEKKYKKWSTSWHSMDHPCVYVCRASDLSVDHWIELGKQAASTLEP